LSFVCYRELKFLSCFLIFRLQTVTSDNPQLKYLIIFVLIFKLVKGMFYCWHSCNCGKV